MKTMTKEMKVTVPENINDLTVGQYQTYALIEKPEVEDMLEIFYKIPRQLVQYLPAAKVAEYTALINNMLSAESTMSTTFKLGDTKFGFITNLEEITYGENKDITTYFGDMRTMHKAMAVMYRPITKENKGGYEIEDYEGSHTYADVMKEAPLGAMLGAMVFFWNLINELQHATQNYFQRMLKKSQKDLLPTQLNYLKKNGEVMENFLRLHKGIFEGMKKSLDFHYKNA